MSFILDALRKSETARRRSETPDIFATMPAATVPARAYPQWPLWAVGVIGVLSLIAALWLFAQRPSAPGGSTAPISTAPASTAPTSTAPALPPPAPPLLPDPTAQFPQVDAPASSPAAPASASQTTAAPVESAIAAAIPATPVPATSPASAAIAEIATPRTPPAPPEPDPPLPQAPPAGDQIVTLADLDPGVRKQLPPLKLSMHLWNETASQRFVILDGQRLKEGDVLGELVVQRITRDGAVLAWRGGRLKIAL